MTTKGTTPQECAKTAARTLTTHAARHTRTTPALQAARATTRPGPMLAALVVGAALTLAGCAGTDAPSPEAPSSGAPAAVSATAAAASIDPNTPLDAQLFEAARASDVPLATAILAEGQTPDVWVDDASALGVAVARDDLSMVMLLVEAGATVADDEGDHILVAAQHAGPDVTQYLLDHGASAVGREGFEGDVLAVASYFNNPATLQVLIDAGGPVNGLFPGGPEAYPVIVSAGFGGHLATAQVLVENGADPSAVGTDGFTAAEWADSNGYTEVAEYLRSVGG